ncbi:MAG: GatB/YqeY domain-containing protein [Bacteroidales bacterium]|nr:GatB/YqeY domain-containing protein [Bacteroidales bacterium]
MLIERIDALIADALKSGNRERCESIKLIKATLLNLEKSGKDYTEQSELNTLMKMKSQIEDSIKQYTEANRNDLLAKERFDLDVLSEFLPNQATDEEIAEETNKAIDELERKPTMADMKTVLAKVKETFPTANGAIVSKVLKERML